MSASQHMAFEDADHRQVYRYVERQGGAASGAVQAALNLDPDILQYLAHHNEIASLDDLIMQIARRENDTSEVHRDRIMTDLLHRQLPKLEEMELVRYEPAQGLVALRDPSTALLVYLSLATE